MIIKADQEARKIIQEMCDIALKSGGIKNLDAIVLVLQSVRPLDPEPVPTEKPVTEKKKE